jgi:3-hydroxy acid dehydrogenase/malonic semialdehyde reductase
LKNKVVFITGASSGIGRSCARAFAQQDARLILAARRFERLKELAVELKRKPGEEILLWDLDVRDQPAVECAVSGLPSEWSAIEVLVNNAGLSRGLDRLHEGKLDDWEEMIDANIKGLLYVSRAVIPGMVKRGQGHIINIGSIAGYEV